MGNYKALGNVFWSPLFSFTNTKYLKITENLQNPEWQDFHSWCQNHRSILIYKIYSTTSKTNMCLLMGILAENTSEAKRMQSSKYLHFHRENQTSLEWVWVRGWKMTKQTPLLSPWKHRDATGRKWEQKHWCFDSLWWETGTGCGQPGCTGISAELSKTRTGNSGFSTQGLQSLYHSAGHGNTPAAGFDGNGLQRWPGFTWINNHNPLPKQIPGCNTAESSSHPKKHI